MKNILLFRILFICALSGFLTNNQTRAQTVIATIGTGSSITGSTTASPINIFYKSMHIQILYPASAMIAAGMTGGARIIDSIAWHVNGAPTYSLPNYTVKMKNTSAANASVYDGTGLTTVYNGTYSPVASSFTDFLPFSSGFLWDGSSNLLIDVCFDPVSSWSSTGTVYYDNVSNSINYVRDDGSSVCGLEKEYVSYYRPHIKIASRPAPPCSTAYAGTLTGPDSVCPSVAFTLNAASATSGASGLTYTWQYSTTSATGPWTTMTGGAKAYTVTAGISTPTWFRMGVQCSGGTISYSTVKYVDLKSFANCYCEPSTLYTSYYINNFETSGGLTNISNLSTGYSTGGYEYFTDDTLTVIKSNSFDFEGSFYSFYSFGVKIWIDYNKNGSFSDVGEQIFGTSSYVTSFTGTATVPATADTGITRMRVGANYLNSSGPSHPCESFSYGEYEDYVVNIRPMPNCSDSQVVTIIPDSFTAVATPPLVCVTGDVILSLDTTMPFATGFTYQWQSSTSATGPWTNLGTPTTSPNYTYPGLSTELYFRCLIYCNGSLIRTSGIASSEAVTPTTPTLNDGQACGPDSVLLTGTVTSGDIFWFEDAIGGVPLGSGDSFYTPYLDATTVFYAAGGAYPPYELQVGNSSTVTYSTAAGPFNQFYLKSTMQMLYTGDQMKAAGGSAGIINMIKFNLGSVPSYTYPDYTISIKAVPSSMTSLVWQTTGMTTVYTNAAFKPTATGWIDFPLSTPFNWDGVSGVVIQVCWSATTGWSSTGTHEYTDMPNQMLYFRTDAAGTACGTIGYSPSTYLPNVIFNFEGCMSDRVPVTAYIRDTPTIDIPIEDSMYCMTNHIFTIPSTPAQPDTNTYLWSTGSTDSFIVVSDTGYNEYWVEVMTEYGCTASDTLRVTLWPSPEVDLGNDTLVCEGALLTLDPHDNDGVSWYWNTGESTPTIVVDKDGTYIVLVKNGYGCISMDTINVTVEGQFPYMDGIIVENKGPLTFYFKPHNPDFVTKYEWDFGDGSPIVTAFDPTHTYAAPGTYLVKCFVESTCGFGEYKTFATTFTGIDENDNINNFKLYPNPANNMLNIETMNHEGIEQVVVVNVLGQTLKQVAVDKQSKYSLDISDLPSGSYSIQIFTKDAMMVKKFQIIR